MRSHLSLSVYLLAFAVVLGGCTTTSSVRPYSPSTPSEIRNGVVYSLPKTILEASMTYSLYEKKTWTSDEQGKPKKTDKDGKPLSPKTSTSVVLVDKPIQVSAKTIPDPSMRFIFDVDSLSGFSKSTEITIELASNGLLRSSNSVVQDKTKEIISSTTAAVLNIAKIAAVAGTDVVEMVPVKDYAVSRIIDPSSDLTFKNESGKYCATFSDKQKAEALFERGIGVPEIAIKLCCDHDISKNIHIKADSVVNNANEPGVINGLPYRVGSPVRVTISVDGREIADQFHMFAQAGTIAVVPLSAKAFSDITQGISFSEDGAYLTKYTSKGTSVGESASATAKDVTGAIPPGIKDVEQVKLDNLKKEKEIIDAEIALAESKKKQSESPPK